MASTSVVASFFLHWRPHIRQYYILIITCQWIVSYIIKKEQICTAYVLFCSLTVLDPTVGNTMDVLLPFIFVLSHYDWLFHGESCPRTDVVYPGCAWFSSPACTWHCSLHYLFLMATPLFPHGVTIVCQQTVHRIQNCHLTVMIQGAWTGTWTGCTDDWLFSYVWCCLLFNSMNILALCSVHYCCSILAYGESGVGG